jgi:RimJ/RimL family protein N-acetyltransferase
MKRVISTDQSLNPILLSWMRSQLKEFDVGEFDPKECRTVAHLLQDDNGQREILGVVAFNRWTPHTCDGTVATDGSKRCAGRDFLFTVYDYAFRFAGKTRMNMIVHEQNEASKKLQSDIGHQLVGTLVDHFGEGKNALLYGLTRSQWKQGRYAEPSPRKET